MSTLEMAFHEAGHIVMTMLWGVWRVANVSIERTGKTGCGTEYAMVTEPEGNEASEALGTRLFDAKLERMLGGPVAQSLLCGNQVAYQDSTGDSDFDYLASVIQDGIPGSSLVDAWARIYERESIVQADLKRMWPVVEALAEELMVKKELSEHQIRAIVRSAVNKLPEQERIWAISRLRNTRPG
jgi:hypothetical protein